MPGPIVQNLVFWRAQDLTLRFGPVKDASGVKLAYADGADWTTKFTMRAKETSASVALQKTGARVTGQTDLYFDVVLAVADLLTLKKTEVGGEYPFSFMRTNTGFMDPLTVGDVTVNYDIYHAK